MVAKILLHLVILCGVLYQGIIATLSKDDVQESSSLLAREKRVVNLEPGGNRNMRIEEANYMVNIKEDNHSRCAGVILSVYTVITAALCVRLAVTQYEVQSGSTYPQYSINHAVTSKETHFGSTPHGHFDGIALLTVNPPFIFGSKKGNIGLYSGPLHTGTLATVSGWGCRYPFVNLAGLPRRLRKITIPIMNHGACQQAYRNIFALSNKYICTYDRQKFCAHTDFGAPLVINNMLAGIHIFKGEVPDQLNPDVFLDLQLPEYRNWIREKALLT